LVGDKMAKKDKIYMPAGTGGLIRYGEEQKELIKIKPRHVVYITIGIIVLEVILKIFF